MIVNYEIKTLNSFFRLKIIRLTTCAKKMEFYDEFINMNQTGFKFYIFYLFINYLKFTKSLFTLQNQRKSFK